MKLSKFIILLLFLQGSIHAISLWQDLADYQAPDQKKFVIIICSCNNKNWYDKNLESAFIQDYPRDKFRIIYVDESRDGTADLVSAYVTAHNEWDRFTLIRNDQWQSVMHNHYKAAHLCDDEEIIIHLDGDDFLKYDKVLWLLNKAYNKWDIWLTYGQYENWPQPEYGFSIDVPAHVASQNGFRDMGFWYSHLRTCYAWLFKSIHLKDLIWQGSFIPTTPAVDYMFMFPMIEMAGEGHYLFIQDVLYLYNRSNALSTCNMPIKLEIPPAKGWKKYQPLKEKNDTITSRFKNKHADLIIFSFGDLEGVENLLSMPDIDQKLLVYSCGCPEDEKKYLDSAVRWPDVACINIKKHDDTIITQCLSNDHCLVITNTAFHLPDCMMTDCIYELERTFAKAFFLGLSKKSFTPCNIPINYGPFADAHIIYRLACLANGISAWQFEYEEYVWEDPQLTSAVLLRKEDFENSLHAMRDSFTVESFKKSLRLLVMGDREIGLLFE